jgi:hypothetical protein
MGSFAEQVRRCLIQAGLQESAHLRGGRNLKPPTRIRACRAARGTMPQRGDADEASAAQVQRGWHAAPSRGHLPHPGSCCACSEHLLSGQLLSGRTRLCALPADLAGRARSGRPGRRQQAGARGGARGAGPRPRPGRRLGLQPHQQAAERAGLPRARSAARVRHGLLARRGAARADAAGTL